MRFEAQSVSVVVDHSGVGRHHGTWRLQEESNAATAATTAAARGTDRLFDGKPEHHSTGTVHHPHLGDAERYRRHPGWEQSGC